MLILNYASALLSVTLLTGLHPISSKPYYCTPNDSSGCWPTDDIWDSFIQEMGVAVYDGKEKVRKVNEEKYDECLAAESDAYKISDAADGICLHTHNCKSTFCQSDQESNLPAFTVLVEDVADIQLALEFANKHDIAVSIKTSGHSYSGSSTQKDSLMIWMSHFMTPNDDESFYKAGVNVTSLNLCNINDDIDILKIGGGEVWGDVYARAARFGNDLIGGGGLTVSAAGGWLQGGGLSAMSRSYGLGIDNVVRFEVVLSNGTIAVADECSNYDLFWALRGGGGGTYGVVISAYVKMHKPIVTTRLDMFFILAGVETENCYDSSPDCALANANGLCPSYSFECPVSCMAWCSFQQVDYASFNSTLISFIDFWVESSLKLDPRWGGYWTGTSLNLFFLGNKNDAEITFRSNVTSWIASLPEVQQKRIWLSNSYEYPSYWDARDRNKTTDKTGSQELNLASRHIPREWVANNTKIVKDLLYQLVWNTEGTIVTSYILGGAVADVGENVTSINPSMRKAVWSLHTYAYDKNNDSYHQLVRNTVGNDVSGSCYNHGSYKEPDWERAFWGSNAEKLRKLASKYDPEKRLNCWHCIGYVDPLSEELDVPYSSPSEVPSMSSSTSCVGSICSVPYKTISQSSIPSIVMLFASSLLL